MKKNTKKINEKSELYFLNEKLDVISGPCENCESVVISYRLNESSSFRIVMPYADELKCLIYLEAKYISLGDEIGIIDYIRVSDDGNIVNPGGCEISGRLIDGILDTRECVKGEYSGKIIDIIYDLCVPYDDIIPETPTYDMEGARYTLTIDRDGISLGETIRELYTTHGMKMNIHIRYINGRVEHFIRGEKLSDEIKNVFSFENENLSEFSYENDVKNDIEYISCAIIGDDCNIGDRCIVAYYDKEREAVVNEADVVFENGMMKVYPSFGKRMRFIK